MSIFRFARFRSRRSLWLLTPLVVAVSLLVWLGRSPAPTSPATAERGGSPTAAESLSGEHWLRLRWQSLLPGMMK